MDPDPGLLSGRYRLGGLLGRGGMADVYDGFDERLARPVAIKILRSTLADDTAMRSRFEREARSVARLSHPAVVAVYDSGEDRGRAYLVMERLPGETLADRIRAGPVDPRWLVPVLADVLGALGAAHALGMVHRDIKPANILLVGDGRAKVADFGIAKIYQDRDDTGLDATGGDDTGRDDLTATGLILGTVAYLSPEQIGGAPASPQADIYAVGVVAYEALAGRKPFVGDNAVAQAHAVADGRTSDLAAGRPDVDPRLAAVVRRAMARRVEDRYPSAGAMLADLVATGLVDGGASGPGDATVALLPPPGASGSPPGTWTRVGEDPGSARTTAMPAPPPDPTRVLAPPALRPAVPPPPAAGRRRAGLIGALVTLAVVVVAAAVVAVLVDRSNGSRTIPPASTTPTSVTPTTGAPAVTVPATTTTSSSTTSTSTSTTTSTTTPATTTTTALPTTTTSAPPPTTTTTSAPATTTTSAPTTTTTLVTTPTSAAVERSLPGPRRPHHRSGHG